MQERKENTIVKSSPSGVSRSECKLKVEKRLRNIGLLVGQYPVSAATGGSLYRFGCSLAGVIANLRRGKQEHVVRVRVRDPGRRTDRSAGRLQHRAQQAVRPA